MNMKIAKKIQQALFKNPVMDSLDMRTTIEEVLEQISISMKEDSDRKRYSQWECQKCKGTFITDSKTRWNMGSCKCGFSLVDDEEDYVRCMGHPKLLKQSDDFEEL